MMILHFKKNRCASIHLPLHIVLCFFFHSKQNFEGREKKLHFLYILQIIKKTWHNDSAKNIYREKT